MLLNVATYLIANSKKIDVLFGQFEIIHFMYVKYNLKDEYLEIFTECMLSISVLSWLVICHRGILITDKW